MSVEVSVQKLLYRSEYDTQEIVEQFSQLHLNKPNPAEPPDDPLYEFKHSRVTSKPDCFS